MEYVKKLMIIPTTEGDRTMTIHEATGTGLGYIYWDKKGYTITAINAERLTVSDICITQDERTAQLFIDELCKLTDWTQNKANILYDMRVYSFHPWGIQERIEDAFKAAMDKREAEKQAQPA